MSQFIETIVNEESQAAQKIINERVLTRLQGARSAAEEKLAAMQSELHEVISEIDARTPRSQEDPNNVAQG